MSLSRAALRRALPRRVLVLAFMLGAMSVFAAGYVINNAEFPDRIVSGLMTEDTNGAADVIVVPGGGVTGPCSTNQNALRRALLAARLYKQGRAPVVLIAGGRAPGGSCAVAEAMAAVVREAGVPDSSLYLETRSRSTWENAAFSAEILRALAARRILLVTDRLHMPRAEACFRALGFAVERGSVPVYEGAVDNVNMLHQGLREYIALAVYRARGFTTAGGTTSQSATRPEPMTATSDIAMVRQRPLILLGASYARSWPLSEAGGYPVVNAGVNGQQSGEMLDRFERDVVAAHPRAVLLWGFINDVFRSPRDGITATTDGAVKNFTTMIERARLAGIEPIVATEITVRPSDQLVERLKTLVGAVIGKQGYQQYVNQHVRATNEQLRTLAAREGLLLLDFERALADSRGARRAEYVDPDGSHVTPAGYDALTAYAAPILKAHFQRAFNGAPPR